MSAHVFQYPLFLCFLHASRHFLPSQFTALIAVRPGMNEDIITHFLSIIFFLGPALRNFRVLRKPLPLVSKPQLIAHGAVQVTGGKCWANLSQRRVRKTQGCF